MNGGKDVKIGHDKRPVSVIPSDEQPLFNISNGLRLTDEFNNPLVTKVDQFFIADASAKRATSVVFPSDPVDKYGAKVFSALGISTVTYGANFDIDILLTNVGFSTVVCPVLQVGGSVVGVGSTTPGEVRVLETDNTTVKLDGFPNILEVRILSPTGLDTNKLYFASENIPIVSQLKAGDRIVGFNIPDGARISSTHYDRVKFLGYATGGITTDRVSFFRQTDQIYEADNVLKIEEQFPETSEVSSTLLGVNRAEVQLSLFSNVSSYGLNKDDWETYQYNGGSSKVSWEERVNKIYGKKYTARIEEETQESAIKLSAFPVPYSFPYNEVYQKIGLYREDQYTEYEDFIKLGNAAYSYFSSSKGQSAGYPSSFAESFLNPADVQVNNVGEIVYSKLPDKPNDFTYAFSKIDDWTDTWRLLESSTLDNPVTGVKIGLAGLRSILINGGQINVPSGGGRPGYSEDYGRFSAIQSRRVFRYQPGRISGFTFGLRSSKEVEANGVTLEWGIANPTDQYMLKIFQGQLSIVRRSTVPLEASVLERNGLDPTDTKVQPQIPSGDPFDVKENFGPYSNANEQEERAILYWTVEIPRDKFNGDPLNGNGPSGYTIEPDNVTMWKIEFGWYGAIGARFYAYIPAGTGEARWVVIHTLVIENSLGQPCLQDSYFRFKYTLNCFNNKATRQPQFLYKYGASYYIDGGDEGTSEIYSVDTGASPKSINEGNETTMFGIRPKDEFVSVTAVGIGNTITESIKTIANRKLTLPTKLNITTNTLTEVKIRTCVGCQGHGHVFTPGVGSTISGREINLEFSSEPNVVSGVGASFTKDDIGSKLIAPSIFNAYITEVAGDPIETHFGKDYYSSVKLAGWGPRLDGYPNYNTSTDESTGGRLLNGAKVFDYATESRTTLPSNAAYPHKVRLSSYNDVHFASTQKLSGAEIKIQFLNPRPLDGISSYRNGTHWSDFLIGVTDKEPTVTGNQLDGWDDSVLRWTDYKQDDSGNSPAIGSGTTTILPNENILYGESTHTWGGMDEDGFEVNERWAPTEFRVRMGEDVRTPRVPDGESGQNGGFCSSIKIVVSDKTDIAQNVIYLPGTSQKLNNLGFQYLVTEGVFGGGITDWLGGQVVVRKTDGTLIKSDYVFAESQPSQLAEGQNSELFGGAASEYIKIQKKDLTSGSLFSDETSGLTLLGKTVTLTGNKLNTTKSKLFSYDVFPLYLVGKLKDNSKINNIMITEKSGDFQKTTSPKLAIVDNGFIDTSDGASNLESPPPNFLPIDRLASATVDLQNLRRLRASVVRDTFYIGENQTKEVDLTKVFGVDRNVITPDNQNIEATFFTAKSLSGSVDKFIQGSLNFREQ